MYGKSRSYEEFFLRYTVQRTEFFVILGHFYPLTLLTQKIKILTKWKNKHPGDIILPKCNINDNHMICGSSDMKCTRQNFFVILDHLLLFYPLPPLPLTAWKIKISKKWERTPGDIIILHKCTKNRDQRLYCLWDMTCDRCNYFLFWAILFPFTSSP